MAHVELHKRADIKGIIRENDRTAKHYKNNVDLSRSHMNWCYGAVGLDYKNITEKIDKRCADIMQGRKVQEQTDVMCQWSVTYPFDLCEPALSSCKSKNGKNLLCNKPKSDIQCREFFDEVYDFVCERYGVDNVVCAYVHMDETTPHMHINFVPEATSRKTGKNTVSSASALTRSELRNFHKELERHIQQTMGIKGAILNGRTKGDYTVEELKERQEQEDLQEQKDLELRYREKQVQEREDKAQEKEENITSRENALNARINDVNATISQINAITRKQDEKEEEQARKQAELDERERAVKQMEDNPPASLLEWAKNTTVYRAYHDEQRERIDHREHVTYRESTAYHLFVVDTQSARAKTVSAGLKDKEVTGPVISTKF